MTVEQAWAGRISLPLDHGADQEGRCSPRPSRGFPGACSGPVGQCHATELLCMEEKYRLLFLLWIALMAVGKTVRLRLSFSISASLLIDKTEAEEGNTLL